MLTSNEVPRIHPKIAIDYIKCTTPFDCRKCAQVCTPSVYNYESAKMERGKETDKKEPGAWKVWAKWPDKCYGCMDCVKVCPVNAISIKIPKEVKS